jgi:formamidopyrimidine-DNA glycosylase
MNREQRRAMAKLEKKGGNEEMAEKVALFGKLGEECLVCEGPFDKKNKEMVMSWSVVVREEEGKVNLYCPTCWNGALKMLQQAKEEILGYGEE